MFIRPPKTPLFLATLASALTLSTVASAQWREHRYSGTYDLSCSDQANSHWNKSGTEPHPAATYYSLSMKATLGDKLLFVLDSTQDSDEDGLNDGTFLGECSEDEYGRRSLGLSTELVEAMVTQIQEGCMNNIDALVDWINTWGTATGNDDLNEAKCRELGEFIVHPLADKVMELSPKVPAWYKANYRYNFFAHAFGNSVANHYMYGDDVSDTEESYMGKSRWVLRYGPGTASRGYPFKFFTFGNCVANQWGNERIHYQNVTADSSGNTLVGVMNPAYTAKCIFPKGSFSATLKVHHEYEGERVGGVEFGPPAE